MVKREREVSVAAQMILVSHQHLTCPLTGSLAALYAPPTICCIQEVPDGGTQTILDLALHFRPGYRLRHPLGDFVVDTITS